MEHFQALAEWLSLYGYPILFGLVFAENAGLPVPGETAVLAAALLASQPGSPLAITWVILVTAVAAILGDNMGFWLGHRWARPRLRSGRRFLFLTPGGLQAVEGYFEHYGALTIFFARFITGLRVVAALAAGTSGMAWPRFFVANAGGAVVWAVAVSLLGYFFGQSWQALHRWMGRGALIILGCLVLLVGLPYLWRRLRQLPAGSWDRLLRARLWEGFIAALLVTACVAVLVNLAERHAARTAADEQVRQWVEAREVPLLNAVATGGSYLGSLPAVLSVVVLLLAWSLHSGGPRRLRAAFLWALVASEGVGLVLLALIRHGGVEPARALAWPFGFAGLAPLRGAAVFGMSAHILARQAPGWGRLVGAAAVVLILLIGFSVVWSGEQTFTEVLVEYVTGSLILFMGLWWLEGYGVGPSPGPPSASP